MTATDYLIWGIVLHLIADWIFQNDWMARNKTSLLHPASYVHGFIHFIAMWIVFPSWVAIWISLVHIAIDTRIPTALWRKLYRQTDDHNNPYFLHVVIWVDQVFHIVTIALFSILTSIYLG